MNTEELEALAAIADDRMPNVLALPGLTAQKYIQTTPAGEFELSPRGRKALAAARKAAR